MTPPRYNAPDMTPPNRGGRNRIGRREKWPKKSSEEGEIGEKLVTPNFLFGYQEYLL